MSVPTSLSLDINSSVEARKTRASAVRKTSTACGLTLTETLQRINHPTPPADLSMITLYTTTSSTLKEQREIRMLDFVNMVVMLTKNAETLG